MAEPTPEVINELVRLMTGETSYAELSDDALIELGHRVRRGRDTLLKITLELRARGYTFAQIGALYGVTESAASRWVDPPTGPPGRPRTRKGEPR